jgi:3-oxoacyl-[acyl-carrier-protein] synthase III
VATTRIPNNATAIRFIRGTDTTTQTQMLARWYRSADERRDWVQTRTGTETTIRMFKTDDPQMTAGRAYLAARKAIREACMVEMEYPTL